MAYFLAIAKFLGALGVFLAGADALSRALRAMSQARIKTVLNRFCGTKWGALCSGTVGTMAVQSSSAIVVFALGLVDTGVLSMTNAAFVVMGANIGTTVSGILIGLNALDFAPMFFCLAFFGFVLMQQKNPKRQAYGAVLLGLGLLFVGLNLLANALSFFTDSPFFMLLFCTSHPLLLLLMGFCVTALIQSSTAVNGVIITLVGCSQLTVYGAVFIILGTNVGTCLMSYLASLSLQKNAKKLAAFHIYFNIIGSVIFAAVLMACPQAWVSDVLARLSPTPSLALAYFNLLQNLIVALLFFPFVGLSAQPKRRLKRCVSYSTE